jgi:putative nucleotidyltransferase with HDIG domain
VSKVRVYVCLISVAGGMAILLSLRRAVTEPFDLAWLIPVTLAVISGVTVLRLRDVAASFSVGDTFSFAALFLYGPEIGTLTVAFATIAISTRLRGPAIRVIFNTAAPCLAMFCAGTTVFGVLGLPLPTDAGQLVAAFVASALAIAIYFLLESIFVAAAVALHEQHGIFSEWRQNFAHRWANPVAGGYVGALIALFSSRIGVAALVALLPIPLILHHTFRTSLGRIDDQLQHLGQMNRMYRSTIEAFATAVDAKDQVTHGHIRRVQTYCVALARALGAQDVDTLKSLEAAALLHDVGKIGIPEHILNKPGPLTPLEFEEMKRHVAIGTGILATIDFPFPVAPIVKHHHENWDGTGYPAGVRGTDIPLAARILSVVDCFDAVTSDRPYRAALSVQTAFDILRARRGTMYDPEVVDAFIALQPSIAIDPEPAGSSRSLALAGVPEARTAI